MGLSISPLYFSKLVGVLIQLARKWGIQISFYMDDTLLRAPSFIQAERDTQVVGNLFQLAGFLLHGDKSVHKPTQRIKYLGFIIDSVTMCLSLPEDKVSRLKAAVKKALRELNKRRRLTVRIAAKTIGFVVSSIPATTYGKAHYRELEFAKTAQLAANPNNFDAPFVWPEECRADLEWWASPSNKFVSSFAMLPHTTTLITDASLEGWGSLCGTTKNVSVPGKTTIVILTSLNCVRCFKLCKPSPSSIADNGSCFVATIRPPSRTLTTWGAEFTVSTTWRRKFGLYWRKQTRSCRPCTFPRLTIPRMLSPAV
jgi:hypothetical protein